jgi:16S rRNA (guanine527-N7)-methyltransferase
MEMNEKEVLVKGISDLGLTADEAQINKLLEFSALLLKWNRVYNLTAITRPDEILTKHILDSLALAQYLFTQFNGKGLSVLDVGCGGGFPSVPCSVLYHQAQYTCVDAVAKKIAFIKAAKTMLCLENVLPLHVRVEDLQGEKFDVITSRAFSTLKTMIELTHNLIAPGGCWIALKGKILEEMSDLPDGYEVTATVPVTVPFLNEERHLVVVKQRG